MTRVLAGAGIGVLALGALLLVGLYVIPAFGLYLLTMWAFIH